MVLICQQQSQMSGQKARLSAIGLAIWLAAVLCGVARSGSALAETGNTNAAEFKLAETW
jgi:hypothetical protein